MTKPEALALLNQIEYKYISFGLRHSDFYSYKDENLSVLKECQKEIPALKIYDSIKKFRLIEPNEKP